MNPTPAINVCLAYRDPLLRAGIAAALAAQADIALPSGDGEPASAAIDVVIADYDSALALLANDPTRGAMLKVLIVTARSSELEIRRAIGAGARGYLVLGCDGGELADGVRTVHGGGRAISGMAAQRMAESLTHHALTVRETEVVRLMARGYPNKAIAAQLRIAIGTVKTHVNSILGKLESASRTEAIAVAGRRGLLVGVEPDEGSAPRAALWRHGTSPRGPASLAGMLNP